MNRLPESLVANWSLLLAVTLLSAVAVTVAILLWRRSTQSRLRREARQYRAVRAHRQKMQRNAESLSAKLHALTGKVDRVSAKKIDGLRGRLQDAESLVRIAADQELVAANRVRLLIVEEFAPIKHERLRRRWLPDDPLNTTVP